MVNITDDISLSNLKKVKINKSEFTPDDIIRFIDDNVYSNPKQAIESLNNLLKLNNLDKDWLLYIYTNLGFAYLRLFEYKISEKYYSKALEINANHIYALANMAHAKYELGEIEECIEYGKTALKTKDESILASSNMLDKPFNGFKNIISYSLFGNSPKYCEMAVLNSTTARDLLPNFHCRFYIDENVPQHVINRLEKNNSEVIKASDYLLNMPGVFWRFTALDDKEVNYILIRDADSLIGKKEVQLINDWIKSDIPFHIIRDASSHTELILAGLFSAKAGVITNIVDKIFDYKSSNNVDINRRYSDQLFLRNYIWPIIKNNSLTYDRFFKYGTCLQSLENSTDENYSEINHIGSSDSFLELKIDLDKDEISNLSNIFISFYETKNHKFICKYNIPIIEDQYIKLALPKLYIENLKKTVWEFKLAKE